MKRYLLVIEGGTEPALFGPYSSDKVRINRAKKIREMQEEYSVFKLNVNFINEAVSIKSFKASEVDPLFQNKDRLYHETHR